MLYAKSPKNAGEYWDFSASAVLDTLDSQYIRIKVKSKYGVMDYSNKIIVPIKYGYVDHWNKNLFNKVGFVVINGNNYGLVNNHGEEVFPVKFDYIDLNKYGDCYVNKGTNKVGLYSWDGNVVIPCNYRNLEEVEGNPFYIIARNDWKKYKTGVYDRRGKVIVPPIYAYVHAAINKSTGEIFFNVVDKYGQNGVYNSSGKLIVPIKYNLCIVTDYYINAIPKVGADDYYNYDFDGMIVERNVQPKKSTSSGWGGQIYFNPNNLIWMAPMWNTPIYAPIPETNNSTVHGINPQETLNQTVGEKCQTCNGSGKCPTCNGTKVASSYGNTYKCTICDEHGNCPSCKGSGKASWNR